MSTVPVLTIDGPSGAGKGTVSRAVAKQLGWNYLDSGAIYRSLAVAAIKNKIDITNIDLLVHLAQVMSLEFECGHNLVVILDDIDITPELTMEETGGVASKIAVFPEVRKVLLQKQIDFQKPPGLVADGRDMGTVVFPNASKKVFLTASAEERGMRRYKQLKEKGVNANLTAITDEIATRDKRDEERSTAPLKQADDAFYLDSSNLSIDKVIEEVLNKVR
jgi:cytidylate kinase